MALSIRVIPCLDVADGRVVKGVRFENLQDAGNPIELAAYYFASGADELTFLDVNATVENRVTMHELVRHTAEQIFIPLTVGGGIKAVQDVERLLQFGADKVSIASAALENPILIQQIVDRFGSQVLVLSLDAKRGDSKSGFIATTHGGRVSTQIDAIDWIRQAVDLGVGEVLVNSIDADGTKRGFDLPMLEAARSASSVPLIASGGAGNATDFVAPARVGVDAILAASIFHNRSVTIEEVKIELQKAGFETR
jgi:cyclase